MSKRTKVPQRNTPLDSVLCHAALHRFFRLCCLLAMLSVLAGCTSPAPVPTRAGPEFANLQERTRRDIALETELVYQERLLDVSYGLRSAAKDLCAPRVAPALGFIYLNRNVFTDEFEDSATRMLALGDALEVAHVAPQSPAESSGLRIGDIILSLAGEPAPAGDDAVEDFTRMVKQKLADVSDPVAMTVLRDHEPVDIPLQVSTACDYPVLLASGDALGLSADGEKVLVSRGMVRFARDDDELAYVIALGLAENILGHPGERRQGFVLGSVVDVLAMAYGINTGGMVANMAAGVNADDRAREADYIALYTAARAGHDIEKVASFWERIADRENDPRYEVFLDSQTLDPERFLDIGKTIAEIQKKQAAGEPLVPQLPEEPIDPEKEREALYKGR